MVKLKDYGMIKYVGVSNFTVKKLQWLLEEDEKPDNNQVELHPYLPQNELIKFCRDHRIEVTAHSPLGSSNTGLSIVDTTTYKTPKILFDPLICQIAKSHNVTPAQVLLKWNISRECPVLVKSSDEGRMKENLESLKINLNENDMESISKISVKHRYMRLKKMLPPGMRHDDPFDGE
ncbi:Aldo-keto reductase family 1 member C4 [Thelohanellus kitauei]|uniref:Aldo-keto reductase family 1 member C4 n=1 Tax=Thelohanellus kitauei TaxID=669202 RepID=A0A0C2I935_THEKT|nr:Aldo-keto reductase family 1 member C4 [Thelohanellus kitauei]